MSTNTWQEEAPQILKKNAYTTFDCYETHIKNNENVTKGFGGVRKWQAGLGKWVYMAWTEVDRYILFSNLQCIFEKKKQGSLKQDHLRVNKAPDQTIILGLTDLLDHFEFNRSNNLDDALS